MSANPRRYHKDHKDVLLILNLLLAAACGSFTGRPPGTKHRPSTEVVDGQMVLSTGEENLSRFEFPEKPGECISQEGCSSAGCSGEACVAAQAATQVTTVCDESHPGQEFFCACVRTRCRWVRDASLMH